MKENGVHDVRPSTLVTAVVSLHTGTRQAKQCVRQHNMALSFNSRLNVDGYRLLKALLSPACNRALAPMPPSVLWSVTLVVSFTVTFPPKLSSVSKHDTASGFCEEAHKAVHSKKLETKIFFWGINQIGFHVDDGVIRISLFHVVLKQKFFCQIGWPCKGNMLMHWGLIIWTQNLYLPISNH